MRRMAASEGEPCNPRSGFERERVDCSPPVAPVRRLPQLEGKSVPSGTARRRMPGLPDIYAEASSPQACRRARLGDSNSGPKQVLLYRNAVYEVQAH